MESRRLLWAGATVAIAAARCVGDASNSSDGGTDATLDQFVVADGGVDAADAAAPMCDVNKTFGTPTLVTALDSIGSVANLRLTPDYLTGYFTAFPADGGPTDIYTAMRSSPTAQFGAGASAGVPSAATSGLDHPSISGDGLSLFFDAVVEVDAGGSGTRDIFRATRAQVGDAWGIPSALANVNTANTDQEAFIREDGTVLYLSSNNVIVRSTLSGQDFGVPTAVIGVNSASGEGGPVVTPDDLVIYFWSTRTDGGAKGSNDIWVASRVSASDGFGAPHNVAELNTPDQDRPDFITRDRCTLIFHRTTFDDAGVAIRNIWMATKTP